MQNLEQRGAVAITILSGIVIILIGIIIFLATSNTDMPKKQVVEETTKNGRRCYLDKHYKSRKTEKTTVVEKSSGIIKAVYTRGGKNYIDIDYVIIGSCIGEEECPNGVTMGNTNPKIRTFQLSSDVKVETTLNGLENLAFIQLRDLFDDSKNENIDIRVFNPWDITIVDGLVTEIVEHFIP